MGSPLQTPRQVSASGNAAPAFGKSRRAAKSEGRRYLHLPALPIQRRLSLPYAVVAIAHEGGEQVADDAAAASFNLDGDRHPRREGHQPLIAVGSACQNSALGFVSSAIFNTGNGAEQPYFHIPTPLIGIAALQAELPPPDLERYLVVKILLERFGRFAAAGFAAPKPAALASSSPGARIEVRVPAIVESGAAIAAVKHG